MKKRRKFSPQFKSQVVLQLLSGERSMAELCREHQLTSPTLGPTATPAPTGLPAIPSGALTATVIRAPVLNVRAGPSAFADRIGSVLRGRRT